jgi:NAD-dependent dihydropyrimidine dehydrogenase PreA subunit
LQLKKIYTFAPLKIKKYKIMAFTIDKELCTACGACMDECPSDSISEGDVYSIDPESCTDCGACADVCPVEAISAA